MTLNQFLKTFARLRKQRKRIFIVTPNGSLRTTTMRKGQQLTDCPLSFVAWALGKRKIEALAIPVDELGMSDEDANIVWNSADSRRFPTFRRKLEYAAGLR
jgi:archaellum biogenesis ATPase FlaH